MHIAKQTSYDSSRDEDPREAVLKYADAAAKDPKYVDTAYTMYNQPVEPQYDDEYEPDAEEPVSKCRIFDSNKKPT